MLSSMTPTIVAKNGKLVLVTGSPGGRTIINTVFTVVLGVTEYGLTGREAVDLARIHHQWMPDRLSDRGEPAEAAARRRTARARARGGDRVPPGGRAHDLVSGDGTRTA